MGEQRGIKAMLVGLVSLSVRRIMAVKAHLENCLPKLELLLHIEHALRRFLNVDLANDLT